MADTIDLPETALDYAINYRYAQDQGLNPDTMRPRDKPKVRAQKQAEETAKIITPTFRHREIPPPTRPAPEIIARAKRPAGITPRLRLTMGGLARAVKPEPAPAPVITPLYPPGYAPAAEIAAEECHVIEAQIFPQEDCIRLVLARDRMSVNTQTQRVNEVLFRDDFSRFMVPRAALANWQAGQAAVLDIPIDQFPPAIARRFQAATREAEVTVTGKGVFVAPGDKIAEVATIQPVVQKPLLRRVVTPLRAAMLALVAIGAATGAILSYSQDPQFSSASTPVDQVDPAVTRFIGTPLDLMGTMAREAGQ